MLQSISTSFVVSINIQTRRRIGSSQGWFPTNKNNQHRIQPKPVDLATGLHHCKERHEHSGSTSGKVPLHPD
jgi:hypothetical protein